MPVLRDSTGRNRRYNGYPIRDIEYFCVNRDNLKTTLSVLHGDELTNETIACLRAYYAGRLVKETFGIQPELYVQTSTPVGIRKAVIVVRVEDALKDAYDDMNNLEKAVFSAKTMFQRYP